MSKRKTLEELEAELDEQISTTDYKKVTSSKVFEAKPEAKPEVTSISIPEFLVGEPYPYFYHTWNKLLLCDLKDTEEVFHIHNDSNNLEENIYIYNKQSVDFETQHKKYGNSLQNYYTVVPQTGTIDMNGWKDEERININNITPILLQKCDNIMTTLLFMPLDQCHDFRGGRTVGSSSWVTETSKGILKKDVDVEDIANGISENLYSNNFMNTLVKTSFSGKQGVIGIMVIGDDSYETLLSTESEYKIDADSLDIQKIMEGYGEMITIASDIMMSCDPKGNRQRLTIGTKVAQILFLGFTSDGWDKGMHDVWSMNEKKHIYSIKIDSIRQATTSSNIEVVYSGDKVTVIDNIVPCYEMLYKSKEEGDANAFINNYQLEDGKKLSKSNFDEFFSAGNFDKLYADFLTELYREKGELHVEEDEEEGMVGGDNSYQSSGVVRGASYKFYGVRAPDTKTSERMTAENRVRHIIFENLFIELLKKISKNISPQVHEDFKYPEETSGCAEGTERINDRIEKVNELYENVKDAVNAENIKDYSKEAYDALKEKMETNERRVIVKQFGTVNDMNIAPVVERVINSLNCSDNCGIKNIEKVEEDVEDVEEDEEKGSKSVVKSKDLSPCKQTIETNIKTDLNNKYPFKFQVVSGVLDSSMQGGENMPEYFPPEIDIFLTIFDAAGNLQGAVIRMTFLKVILKNTTNTKNNARVYSHFIYVGFDEITMECEDKLGNGWKQNVDEYSFALKQLMDYTVRNTYLLPSLNNSLISNFEVGLKDGIYRRWYFYFSDSAGPSVSEGINDIVKKIFGGQIGMVSDDNIDVSESIVKVAQHVYMDAPTLKEVFTQQTGSTERSYAFESIFLLRIKYIGDKSRCTDSLFLNRNKYAECMQITGDENAYFTALVNGASTIYSPPSKFALYFAPYFTYGDVATVGKFLLNVPVYKETLLKGESPSVFKINTSSSKKKTVDTDSVIPFESSYVKDKGPLKTGSEVRSISNDMLRFILNSLDLSYFAAQLRSRNINEVMEIEDIAKKSKQQRDTKKYLDGYVQDYNEIEEMYNELKDKTLGGFVNEIKRATNSFNGQYYSKLIEQLENVFVDNDFIIEQVTLTGNDFQLIKQDITEFLTKALESMKKMIVTPFDKANPPLLLDLDGNSVIDKKGNPTKLTQGAYSKIQDFIPMYEAKLATLRQIEDAEDLKTVLKELNEMYNKNIIILSGVPKSVIFWTERINDYINTVLSVSDIINHILPNIKAAKTKFASQTNKYDKFKPVLQDVLDKLPDLSKKKSSPKTLTPLEEKPKVEEEKPKEEEEKPKVEEEKPKVEEEKPKVEEEVVVVQEEEPKVEEVPKATSASIEVESTDPNSGCVGDRCVISGGANNDSYRKNQIYILKCFSDLIKTNSELYANLLTGNKINYTNIDTIDKFCIAILLLQSNYSLDSYNPRVKSLEDIVDEISKLDENTTSLTDAINIRNYYTPIINNFIDIEYMDPDAVDYILNLYNVEMVDGENIVEEIYNLTNISYYLTLFIYDNLRAINLTSSENEAIFGTINTMYNDLNSIDVKEISAINSISDYKKDIDSSDLIDEEEKTNFKKQIADLEKYESSSLQLIKFCNTFISNLSRNSLKVPLYSFDNIITRLTESGNTDLVEKFNSIEVTIDMPLAKGLSLKKYSMPVNKYKQMMPNINIPSRQYAVQAAGSYKAKRVYKNKKTKKQMINKKGNKKTKCRKVMKKCKYTKKAL